METIATTTSTTTPADESNIFTATSLSTLLQGRKCNEWALLSNDESQAKLQFLPEWSIRPSAGGDETIVVPMLHKVVTCKNFAEALKFVNQAGAIAEELNHHPDLHITGWNKVEVVIFTHSLGGLTELDFILANCIDKRVNVILSKKRAPIASSTKDESTV